MVAVDVCVCVHVLYAAAIKLEDTRKQLNLKQPKG